MSSYKLELEKLSNEVIKINQRRRELIKLINEGTGIPEEDRDFVKELFIGYEADLLHDLFCRDEAYLTAEWNHEFSSTEEMMNSMINNLEEYMVYEPKENSTVQELKRLLQFIESGNAWAPVEQVEKIKQDIKEVESNPELVPTEPPCEDYVKLMKIKTDLEARRVLLDDE